MDFDIEMDDAVEDGPITETYTTDIIEGDDQEPGEIDDPSTLDGDGVQPDEKAVVPYKVYLRGLDTFNPDDLKAYLAQHYSFGYFDRIEWIDDSSANLVFTSESTAQDALTALAAVEIADPAQLPPQESLPAKSFSGKPDSTLHVRFAVTGDKKIAGAAARSRFYLLNPEYDPEERRRRGELRGKHRDREGYGRDRDRRNGRKRDSRYDEGESEPFDVSLYDDDEAALAKRAKFNPQPRRDSPQIGDKEEGGYSRRNRDKELFPNRRPGDRDVTSSRGRSASPGRNDSRMEMDDLARDREAVSHNREKAQALKDRLSKDNRAKELFPSKVAPTTSMGQANPGKILPSAKLTDRIAPRATEPASSAFNIRGLATKRGADQGFAIKGTGATVKELFPEKFSNSGKELFADRLEGRGRRRQRAEDMFH